FNRQIAPMAHNFSFDGLKRAVQLTGTSAEQRPLATGLLKRARHGAHGKAQVVLRTLLAWNGSYNQTDAHGTVDPGVASSQALKAEMQRLALAPPGRAGRIIGGELPNREHGFDVSPRPAYALRRPGPASRPRAASRVCGR